MGIADKIMRLFKVEIPLNLTNAAVAIRNTVGESNFKAAVRHLCYAEEKLVLEQYEKDELIEMLLNQSLPPDVDASLDEFFETYVKPTMGSIGEFVEYLDEKLPKDLRL